MQEPKLADFCRKILAECDDDREKAKEEAFQRILAEKNKLGPITGLYFAEAFNIALSETMRSISSVGRKAILRSTPADQLRSAARMQEMAIEQYLDFPLYGGIRMRRAKKADLQAMIDWYDTEVRERLVRKRWLELILAELPDGETEIGDVFTDDQLDALWRKAQEEVR